MISVPERVKDALREGNLLKNYRFCVLKSDGTVDFTIDNDSLVYESVKFDERMCSGDVLKFGLCEGSSLEFQYFDNPNITGRQLQCFIDVQYKDANGDLDDHTIPMGFFKVKKCSRQASTGIQKVTAYNKLQSDYLDANIIQAATPIPSDFADGKISTYALRCRLLSNYSISYYKKTATALGIPEQATECPVFMWAQNVNFQLVGDTTVYTPRIKAGSYYWAKTDNLTDVYLEVGALEDYQLDLDAQVSHLYEMFTHMIYDYQNVWESFKGHLYKMACAQVEFKTAPATYVTYYYTTPTLYEWAKAAGATNVRMISDMGYLYNVRRIYFTTLSIFEAIRTVGQTIYVDYTYNNDYLPYSLGTALTDQVYQIDYSEMNEEDLIRIPIEDVQDATLRQIMSATYELTCQFGKLDRETDYFSGVELNHTALYPADSLYPADNLYPGGVSETSFRSWYSKLWTDTVGEQSFRKLIITYKGLDEAQSPTDLIYETVVNQNGTTDYVMDDNWLFKNQIWDQAEIAAYAAAMVSKMQSIKWFPFEMWAAGLPYIETGDMIEIIVGDETHTSYVLQRQLSGIQNLQDTYINGTLDIF